MKPFRCVSGAAGLSRHRARASAALGALAVLSALAALAFAGADQPYGCRRWWDIWGGAARAASRGEEPPGRPNGERGADGAGEPVYAIRIETPLRTLVLYQRGREVRRYRVAVGAPETPTPIGRWRIVEKLRWGGGFGGYWLGLDVPWGRYGIHGTTRPWSVGEYASAGCVRMFTHEVAELFALVPVGTPVTIAGPPFYRYGEERRIIRPAHIGSDVAALQRALVRRGLYPGPVDGKFGPATEEAVRAFQAQAGLPATGVVDLQTYERLALRPAGEDPELVPGRVGPRSHPRPSATAPVLPPCVPGGPG